MILKTVSLPEAKALLPFVRDGFMILHNLLAKLQMARKKLHKKTQKPFLFNSSSFKIMVIRKKCNPKKSAFLARKIRRLERKIEEEIAILMKCGVVVQSLFPPHIDFLSTKNNGPIFLCWHALEQNICHWHQVGEKPYDRQKIEHENHFGNLVIH